MFLDDSLSPTTAELMLELSGDLQTYSPEWFSNLCGHGVRRIVFDYRDLSKFTEWRDINTNQGDTHLLPQSFRHTFSHRVVRIVYF